MSIKLEERALLVQLSIKQWSANKQDKKATSDITSQARAASGAARVHKSLLPGAFEREEVQKCARYIRQYFYANTLPWGLDGMQMLPVQNYMDFMAEFRAKRSHWLTLVDKFCCEYPRLRYQAQQSLGHLYNHDDYPMPSEVERRFDMDLAVFPVPTNDFRVAIAGDELARIQNDVVQRVQEAQAGAMREAWQRLYDRVSKIAERLADPTAVFRDSLIENAQEICALLPRLNFTNDPQLEYMRQQVEQHLVVHPEALRTNLTTRENTAQKAQEIMDKMAVFMGGI